MKNLLVIIALYILTLLLVACDRNKAEVLSDTLRRAEELMESHSDSASGKCMVGPASNFINTLYKYKITGRK